MHLAVTVLEHVQTGIVAVDDGGLVALFNAAAARTLGVPIDNVMWRSLATLSAEEGALGALATILAEARDQRTDRRDEQVVVQTEAGPRSLGYAVTFLGSSSALVMAFSDLTDTLTRQRDEAAERHFADLGRVASTMAHDLKSPLATIALYTDLLRRSRGDDAQIVENLDVISAEVRQCRERITAVLRSVSRPIGGERVHELVAVDPVLTATLDELHQRHPAVELTCDIDVVDRRVALAADDLASVITNLVENAIEASADRPVEIAAGVADGRLRVTVADRGPGLPKGDVFQPFFTTKPKGTGLGLWIVRRTVRYAGGDVAARDREDGGAEFLLDLPVADHARLRGRELLVVVDDQQLAAALGAALSDAGAHVTVAASAEEAETTLGERGIDCLITDYHLPGRDGTTLAAGFAPATPIVVISSDGGAAEALASLRRERARFLEKPFVVDDLLDIVSIVLAGRPPDFASRKPLE